MIAPWVYPHWKHSNSDSWKNMTKMCPRRGHVKHANRSDEIALMPNEFTKENTKENEGIAIMQGELTKANLRKKVVENILDGSACQWPSSICFKRKHGALAHTPIRNNEVKCKRAIWTVQNRHKASVKQIFAALAVTKALEKKITPIFSTPLSFWSRRNEAEEGDWPHRSWNAV